MYNVTVIDRTAESRNKLVEKINHLAVEGSRLFNYFPQITVKPVAVEEYRFSEKAQMVIVGHQLASEASTEVRGIREHFSQARIAAMLPTEADLFLSERLVRLGVDDFLTEETPAAELLRRLLLLTRERKNDRSGTLILVVSGKGGAGVTSVAAALGEALLEENKRTLLVDFDYETQDLTRFLQVRPFINENLELLLTKERAINAETVRETVAPVWVDDERLFIMPPPAEEVFLRIDVAQVVRTLVQVFEIVDSLFDFVVVDAGAAHGSLLEALTRVADKIVCVVPNDAAAILGSVATMRKMNATKSPDSDLIVIENRLMSRGLSSKTVRESVRAASDIADSQIVSLPLPWSSEGSLWAATGGTLLSLGKKRIERPLRGLLGKLSVIPEMELVEKGNFDPTVFIHGVKALLPEKLFRFGKPYEDPLLRQKALPAPREEPHQPLADKLLKEEQQKINVNLTSKSDKVAEVVGLPPPISELVGRPSEVL